MEPTTDRLVAFPTENHPHTAQTRIVQGPAVISVAGERWWPSPAKERGEPAGEGRRARCGGGGLGGLPSSQLFLTLPRWCSQLRASHAVVRDPAVSASPRSLFKMPLSPLPGPPESETPGQGGGPMSEGTPPQGH